MSVPQWNADIITPEVEAEAEIQANAGLEKDSSGALGVNVDGSSVTINNEGELEAAVGTVDQTYDPTSSNAQSGTAVAEALSAVWNCLGLQPTMPSSVPSGYVRVRYTGSYVPNYADINKYGGIAYISDLDTIDFDQSKINTSGEADTIFKSGPFEIIGGVLVGNNGDTVKFAGATELTSVSGLSLANDVTSIAYLFQGCTSLESVNTFDTSNVTTMDSAFQGDTSLASVNLFNTSSAVSMISMFRGCTAVESGALALYQQASGQTTPPITYAYCFTDCGSDTTEGAAELAQIDSAWKGVFDPYNSLGLPANTIRVQFTGTDAAYDPTQDTTSGVQGVGTWTHVYGSLYDCEMANSTTWTLGWWSEQYQRTYNLTGNKHVKILGANSTGVTSLNSFASGHKYLESIALFDTSAVTNFSNFLKADSSAIGPTTLPLYDTSSATTMASAFQGCKKVESGALAIYQQASTQATPPGNHTSCFTNCGSGTARGKAELAQIPTSWGGTME